MTRGHALSVRGCHAPRGGRRCAGATRSAETTGTTGPACWRQRNLLTIDGETLHSDYRFVVHRAPREAGVCNRSANLDGRRTRSTKRRHHGEDAIVQKKAVYLSSSTVIQLLNLSRAG